MPVERTVELDEWVDEHVESVRRSFTDTAFGELDYDTAVNMLVVGGLVFPPEDPSDPRWQEVYAFLDGEDVDLTPSNGYETGIDDAER